MNNLTMLIGLPRSGKTTWALNHKHLGVIISADQFRQLMYGQRFYKPGEALMWATRDIALTILLQQGADIIIDETNTTDVRRAKIISEAKKYGYEVDAVWFDVWADTCKQRAMTTNQEDLLTPIDKMDRDFDYPHASEGFRRVTIVKDGEECTIYPVDQVYTVKDLTPTIKVDPAQPWHVGMIGGDMLTKHMTGELKPVEFIKEE